MSSALPRSSAPLWYAGAMVVIATGVLGRVSALDEQSLWHDEIYSLSHVSGFDAYVFPSSDLNPFELPRAAFEWRAELERDRYWHTLSRNLVHEGHPPLYQLGLKAWTSLFGDSIGTIRAFSLFAALLSLPVVYLIGLHLHGAPVGLAAAVLYSVSPFHFYYSIEARGYSWALLFSSVALLAMTLFLRGGARLSSKVTVLWALGVVGAMFSHYYAGLFCAVLLLVIIALGVRSWRILLTLGAPFVAFLPWLPVLRSQLAVHGEHWTNGAPTVPQAAVGFAAVILDQLTGVFHSASLIEQAVAGLAFLGGLVLLRRRTSAKTHDSRLIFLAIPAYGVAVLTVDLLTDHHTVLVTRYLASMLPLVVITAAWLVTGKWLPYKALLTLFAFLSGIGAVATAEGLRAPKQMLREVAEYIAQRYASGDIVLVTPSGPTLLGVAMYLPADVLIAAAPPEHATQLAEDLVDGRHTVWFVRQNLGAGYELATDDTWLFADEGVRFAGVDVRRISSGPPP